MYVVRTRRRTVPAKQVTYGVLQRHTFPEGLKYTSSEDTDGIVHTLTF